LPLEGRARRKRREARLRAHVFYLAGKKKKKNEKLHRLLSMVVETVFS